MVGFKLLAGAAVLYAVARHVFGILSGLSGRAALPRVAPVWLLVAFAAYLVGLVLNGLWFGAILKHSTSPVTKWAAVRAYLISHLGKYVPGKALVVVMRVGLVVPAGARASTATLATLYETLVMMAAGGLTAALGFLLVQQHSAVVSVPWFGPRRVPFGLLGFGLGALFLSVTIPEVFRRLARPLIAPFRRSDVEVVPRFSLKLLAEGLAWTTPAWLLLGLSQVAVLWAFGWGAPITLELWPAVIASVALATVAGFTVPVVPGGLGVREWVLWTSLGTVLDHERAVVSTLTLRLVWVLAEVGAACVLLFWKQVAQPPAPSSAHAFSRTEPHD
jgi:uncharacterized membrane protein YbhN (UPF0104 family)